MRKLQHVFLGNKITDSQWRHGFIVRIVYSNALP